MATPEYPGHRAFFVEAPLYAVYNVPYLPPGYEIPEIEAMEADPEPPSVELVRRIKGHHRIRLLLDFEGPFDCYCPGCDKESTFRSPVSSPRVQRPEGEFVSAIFHCTRAAHTFFAALHLDIPGLTVMKVGQFPSLADLAVAALGKYRKTLGKELYSEFNRAVGLAAHGVGVGSFVYLRRVFERLLDEAQGRAKAEGAWDATEPAWEAARIGQKISLLERYLPEFLVQNRALYGVLSQGIHSLSEEQCLAAFPIVKTGIELILDEKLAREEREAKTKAATEEIARLKGELKKKEDPGSGRTT